MPKKQSNLREKLFNIMKSVPTLEKTGQMEERNGEKSFKYHEGDELRGKFHSLLVKNRVLCMTRSVVPLHWGNPTSTGGTFNYSEQLVTFSFMDVDSDASIDIQSVGWGGDSLDRAAPKALTQAFKYGFVTNFHVKGIIIDGDDVEEQRAGEDANRQHQTFEGVPECFSIGGDYAWIMMPEGLRLYSIHDKITKKMASLSKKFEKSGVLPLKIRTYMGQLNGNGVNPHPIIAKIEVIEAKTDEKQPVSAEIQPN